MFVDCGELCQKWNFGIVRILLKMLKGARVASSGFLISTQRDIRTVKKLRKDSQNKAHPVVYGLRGFPCASDVP